MPDSTDSEHSDPATCHLCGDRAATQAGFLIVNTRVFPHDSLCDECSMTAEEVVSVLAGTDDRQLQYLRNRGLLSPADGSTITDGRQR